MKTLSSFILILLSFALQGQSSENSLFGDNPETVAAQHIVVEGKKLYRSEIASWHGTDLVMKSTERPENVGGYISYGDGESTKCVFFSNSEPRIAVATVVYDSIIDPDNARIDFKERDLSVMEKDFIDLRLKTMEELKTDTLFKFYENTNPNIIPLIDEKGKRVYVITGTNQRGVVLFGNDYILNFDKDNSLLSKKAIHAGLRPVAYSDEDDGVSKHIHFPGEDPHITATDICTLMLYSKFTKWRQHDVHSMEYVSIWNCAGNSLLVMSDARLDKIYSDQEQRQKEREANAESEETVKPTLSKKELRKKRKLERKALKSKK